MVMAQWRAVIFIGAWLLSVAAVAAVDARVDRTTFPVTDSLRVVFETDQSVDGSPDWSPLNADFEILGTSQSTSVNIINGRMRRAATWNVDLMARRPGMLIVPSIRIGSESTRPIGLKVQAGVVDADGVPAGDAFLEVEVDSAAPYVQEQLIFTIRLFRRVTLSNASLTEPSISGGDIAVERLGDDIGYETRRGNTTFAVVERRYAMFAQSSGLAVIQPLLFEGRAGSASRSAFDPFSRGRVVRARSKPIEIDVRPIPDAFAGRVWLPASQLLLVESMSDGGNEFRVGEPVTRTLTLRANGLAANQLPEIASQAPDGIKQYPDQPVLENRPSADGVRGIRQEKVALIPARAGMMTLPAVTVPWWNTRTDELEYARLAERVINVLPASGAAGNQSSSLLEAPVASVAKPNGLSLDMPAKSSDMRWRWVSGALAVGWLATVLVWWYRSRRKPLPAAVLAKPSQRQLRRNLERACQSNMAVDAQQALLAWAGQRWPGSQIRSLGQFAARLEGELQGEVHLLSQALYAESDRTWSGEKLWQLFEEFGRARSARVTPPDPQLEPMYLRR